jgi:hypothetical protein
MNYDFLTDAELLAWVYAKPREDKFVNLLAERLEMRLREIKDLQDEVQRLEDQLEHYGE